MDAASTGVYNFQVRHPRCVVQNIKYKQNIVKHNSVFALQLYNFLFKFSYLWMQP